MEDDAEVADPSPGQAKFVKTLREFDTYIRGNAGSIPNYGERYRAGEVISGSIAESAVNQVISKRMVKKQQLRWGPRGTDLLLQLRTRVLNDSLADDFHRWHPGFTHVPDRQVLAACLRQFVPLSHNTATAVVFAFPPPEPSSSGTRPPPATWTSGAANGPSTTSSSAADPPRPVSRDSPTPPPSRPPAQRAGPPARATPAG